MAEVSPPGSNGKPAVKQRERKNTCSATAVKVIPVSACIKALLNRTPTAFLKDLPSGDTPSVPRKVTSTCTTGMIPAKEKLQMAIDQATEYGLLGTDIFGSGFNFTITLKEGAGGYVCGESTALMASLEGRAGEPRPKYIHTAEKGLWESPTNLNNVETWCNVPPIISRGANWYTKIGTEGSKGTKVISLSGAVNRSCLVEVPYGNNLKEDYHNLGGGVPKGS